MAARIASAAIAFPLVVLVVWAGAPWFTVMVAIAAAVGALEVSSMARRWGNRPAPLGAAAMAAALVVAAHVIADESSRDIWVLPAVGVGAVVALVWLLRRPSRGTLFSALVVTVAAAVYIGGLLFHAPLLRGLDQGREWVLLLLIVTVANDTSAFFVGKALGHRPMAPSISPAKTWEGSVGGFAGALGASVAAVTLLDLDSGVSEALVLGAIIGVVAQLGDLVESRLKRISDVKDSGWLMPGHGGVLDRLDSIVFNLVVVYYFVS